MAEKSQFLTPKMAHSSNFVRTKVSQNGPKHLNLLKENLKFQVCNPANLKSATPKTPENKILLQNNICHRGRVTVAYFEVKVSQNGSKHFN